MRVNIKFTKPWQGFQPGHIMSCTGGVAHSYVKHYRVAEYAEEAARPKPKRSRKKEPEVAVDPSTNPDEPADLGASDAPAGEEAS